MLRRCVFFGGGSAGSIRPTSDTKSHEKHKFSSPIFVGNRGNQNMPKLAFRGFGGPLLAAHHPLSPETTQRAAGGRTGACLFASREVCEGGAQEPFWFLRQMKVVARWCFVLGVFAMPTAN